MYSIRGNTQREGEAKAIIELGFEFGLSEEEILDRLQKKTQYIITESTRIFFNVCYEKSDKR